MEWRFSWLAGVFVLFSSVNKVVCYSRFCDYEDNVVVVF